MSTTNNNSTINSTTIVTDLINKEEVFRILALGASTELPVLLNGEKGTAKTATVLDFMKSFIGETGKDFVIELSNDTKASSLLGKPDMKKFAEEKHWEMERPIADADVVVINEVDKSTIAVRNVLLSVMSEKRIHDGKYSKDCNYKLFVATANEIPKGEETLPFWDRFPIKYDMPRVSNKDLLKFMSGDRKKKPTITIPIPTKDQLLEMDCNYNYVGIFLDELDKQAKSNKQGEGVSFSDRAKTKLDLLIKATRVIWNLSEEQAVLKVASIFCKSILKSLEPQLMPKEVAYVLGLITDLEGEASFVTKKQTFPGLRAKFNQLKQNPAMAKYVADLEAKVLKIQEDLDNEALKDLDDALASSF